ncbi:MAG: hypothetical protein ACRCXT_09040 [Paraclostridium sp.]
MNKRRNIYRGVNKRRNQVAKVAVIGSIIICVLGGIAFTKFFDFSSIVDKFKEMNIFAMNSIRKVDEYEYGDIIDEVNKDKESDINTDNEVAKSANIMNWNMYSVQIAALDNEEELKEVESKLTKDKIPFSIIEIDNIKKVQTYASFNEEESRKNLEVIKEDFPDAFVSKLEVPLVNLQYTDKYGYVENICAELNNLINNLEEESSFWIETSESVSVETYEEIQKNRETILKNLEKEAKKIDYEGMEIFKSNLLEYIKSMSEKSNQSLKMVKDKNYYVSESLFMSSMQGYYSFINSIKSV